MRAVSGSGSSIMSDSWMDWKPRTDEPSKASPSSNTLSIEQRSRHREVLDNAGQIAEPNVDVLDVFVLDLLDDVVGGLFCH